MIISSNNNDDVILYLKYTVSSSRSKSTVVLCTLTLSFKHHKPLGVLWVTQHSLSPVSWVYLLSMPFILYLSPERSDFPFNTRLKHFLFSEDFSALTWHD